MNTNVSIKKPAAASPRDICEIPCFKADLVRRLRAEVPGDETLEEMRAIFAALADRARLKILLALKDDDELCVCDVAHVIGCSISTASHHLRRLRDLRLLRYRNDGKMAYYSLRSRLARRLIRDALQSALRAEG